MSLNASSPLASVLVVSLGVGAFWHASVSFRSGLKQFVGDAHFYVVCFTGEQ